ncbi:MAG: hypothetical protein JKY02_00740 [Flavobacteriaceae bacterium]|nr:hypothetical protein [Flavobacteriaceae bacterium]
MKNIILFFFGLLVITTVYAQRKVGETNSDGQTIGLWKFYNEENELVAQGNYINGKYEGKWNTYATKDVLSFSSEGYYIDDKKKENGNVIERMEIFLL